MNILLIDHYAGSPRHGMEYRPYYFAREWTRLGHNVVVAAASYSHLRTEQPSVRGSWTEEDIDGVRFVWVKTPAYPCNGIRRAVNIFAFVRKMWFNAKRFARQFQPDLVIASSTYPLDVIPARRIAAASSARLVYEVHDLWPLTLVTLGGMPVCHPFVQLLQRAENYAYRHSDYVVSLLPMASDYMQEHGMAAEKFCCIPNGVSPDEWRCEAQPLPEEHGQAIRQIKQAGYFVVGYAGGHALSNALDSLLEAASRLRDRPIRIVLVGSGVEKSRLQQRAQSMGLDNVVFLPPVPKQTIPSLLREFDVCYLGWARSPLYRFGVCPNKLLDYMMAARPVIHAIDAGNDLVAEADCGISIPPEDADAIAGAMVAMSEKTPQELAGMGQNGQRHVMAYHSYPQLAQRFLDDVCR